MFGFKQKIQWGPRVIPLNEIPAVVSETIKESSSTSISHRTQKLSIPRSSLPRILTKDL